MIDNKKRIFLYTLVFLSFSLSLISFNPYFFSGTGLSGVVLLENSLLVRVSYFVPGLLFVLFGYGAYLFIAIGLLAYALLFPKLRYLVPKRRFLGLALLLFSFSFLVILLKADASFSGGGIVFGLIADFINVMFGMAGKVAFLLCLLWYSFFFIFDKSLKDYAILLWSFDYAKRFKDILLQKDLISQNASANGPTVNEKYVIDNPASLHSSYSDDKDVERQELEDESILLEKPLEAGDVVEQSEEFASDFTSYDGYLAEDDIINSINILSKSLDIEALNTKEFATKALDIECLDTKEFATKALDIECLDTKEFDTKELDNVIDNSTELRLAQEKVKEMPSICSYDSDVIIETALVPSGAHIAVSSVSSPIVVSSNKARATDFTSSSAGSSSYESLYDGDGTNDKKAKFLFREEETEEDYEETYQDVNGAEKLSILSEESEDLGENLLAESENLGLGDSIDEDTNKEQEPEIISKLEGTLKEFGISARVINVASGPVITRYEILPAPGVRLSKISNLQDNIALALASLRIRVIAPIPGKSLVGIEIPNRIRKSVHFSELINSPSFKENKYHLPIALGKGIEGKTVIAELVSMPHMLIAGATGSGKSVFVNTLICSLLYSTKLSNMRLLLIDPKRVELSIYNNIPNLLAPVITHPKKALIALKWAVHEMERRYSLLEKYGVRDIRGFNSKVSNMKANGFVTDVMFEYIVIIIDEFADLMMTSSKEVEMQVSRLAAMSRAVGIHLVIATQRPSVDVITGLIKANFPARIAFQVSSKTESRIILDANGADKLLGKGDLLFSAPGFNGTTRIQGAFLKEEDILRFLDNIKGPTNYVEELENIVIDDDDRAAGGSVDGDSEPLYREAVEVVRADRKASASYLQRKMRIGYNRAARIIELMEEEGIISPQNGSKPREVLV